MTFSLLRMKEKEYAQVKWRKERECGIQSFDHDKVNETVNTCIIHSFNVFFLFRRRCYSPQIVCSFSIHRWLVYSAHCILYLKKKEKESEQKKNWNGWYFPSVFIHLMILQVRHFRSWWLLHFDSVRFYGRNQSNNNKRPAFFIPKKNAKALKIWSRRFFVYQCDISKACVEQIANCALWRCV